MERGGLAELTALFSLNERYDDMLVDFLSTHSLRVPSSGLPPKHAVILTAIGKATKTHQAIVLLCGAGLGEDAFALLRTLFELAVGVRYVLNDSTQGRACRWLDYECVNRYETHKAIESDPVLRSLVSERGGADQEMVDEIHRQAREAQAKWGFWRQNKETRELNQPLAWSGLSMRRLATKVGWDGHYNTVYRLASLEIHPGVHTAHDNVFYLGDGRLKIRTSGSIHLLDRVLWSAAVYLHEIAQPWCSMFAAGETIESQVAGLGDELKGIAVAILEQR